MEQMKHQTTTSTSGLIKDRHSCRVLFDLVSRSELPAVCLRSRLARGLVVKNDVAAGETAACGIDVSDSDRKRIGAIIYVDNESAHPASYAHRSGKMRMITAHG